MNIVELIRKKREGGSLTEEEFRYMITNYVEGRVPDYQMSAFLMAAFFRGMSKEETLTFTKLMLHSGAVLDLSEIPGIKVDKHSTGGVGDKVSLILAPMVAACGVPVPMISGRGLGHTGGTLDKLESILGFRTNLSIDEYKRVIREIGLVMIGQTKEIAPADKKMYALRDVTATVECIPLIAGSIMSKKLAEGIDALVLDVKTGRGAFMQTYERSLELAQTLVDIGNGFGKETIGFITDMNQPLGTAIGNWLEVVESVECLRGTSGNNDASADLMEVTYVLSGAMVYLGKKAKSIEEGIEKCKRTIQDGSAYKKFLDLVRIQGGNVETIEHLETYPKSKYSIEIRSTQKGFVESIDSFELGLTSIMLGAGREKIDDVLDMKAGIVLKKKVGDAITKGEPLAFLYTDRQHVLDAANRRIAKAYSIAPQCPQKKPLILKKITASDNA
ncbi:MAG TPA: thymidine phosphorylase [Bacteroidota bacterium]|nr:thymidine phosphorylase [Bacteroidota bacterium]